MTITEEIKIINKELREWKAILLTYWFDTDVFVELRVSERKLHRFFDFLNLLLEATNISIGLLRDSIHNHHIHHRISIII